MASDSKITAWNRFSVLVEAKITLSNGAQLTFCGNATQGGEHCKGNFLPPSDITQLLFNDADFMVPSILI